MTILLPALGMHMESDNRICPTILAAMLVYNLAVAILLTIAALGSGLHGLILWPGAVLHTVMAIWCVICLRPKSRS